LAGIVHSLVCAPRRPPDHEEPDMSMLAVTFFGFTVAGRELLIGFAVLVIIVVVIGWYLYSRR
jgi:hypothetical protein